MASKKQPARSWKDIRAVLNKADHKDLIKLVGDMYALRKENQDFLHARFLKDASTLGPYKENIENTGDQETIVYNLMFERENILNKSILHKVWSKTTLSDLHKFMLFHLIENFPFNLPHTFYINIQKNLKGLGGPDDIYYAALINKMLWD